VGTVAGERIDEVGLQRGSNKRLITAKLYLACRSRLQIRVRFESHCSSQGIFLVLDITPGFLIEPRKLLLQKQSSFPKYLIQCRLFVSDRRFPRTGMAHKRWRKRLSAQTSSSKARPENSRSSAAVGFFSSGPLADSSVPSPSGSLRRNRRKK
jgi:hypothetical protein